MPGGPVGQYPLITRWLIKVSTLYQVSTLYLVVTLYLVSTLYLILTYFIRFEKLLLLMFILLNLAIAGAISMFIFYFDSKED